MKIEKTLLILSFLFVATANYAQSDSLRLAAAQRMLEWDSTFYTEVVNRLGARYGLDFEACDCQRNEEEIFFMKWGGLRSYTDAAGATEMWHKIAWLKKRNGEWKGSAWENQKALSPQAGWEALGQGLLDMDLSSLPPHYGSIKYTVIARPDGFSYYLRICEKGMPKVYYIQDNLELITLYDMVAEELQRSGELMLLNKEIIRFFNENL